MTGMRAAPTKVDEKLKKKLITILLKVYMSGRCVSQTIIESRDPESLFFLEIASHPSIKRPGY